MNNRQAGFTPIIIVLVIVVALIGFGVYYQTRQVSPADTQINTENSVSSTTTSPAATTTSVTTSTEESSAEVFTNQPGAVKSVTKVDAHWNIALDLLSYKPDWLPGVNERFMNQSTKIRTLRVTTSTKTYNCVDTHATLLVDVPTYMSQIQKTIDRVKAELKFRVGGQPIMTDWALYDFDIRGENITAIYQPCLP